MKTKLTVEESQKLIYLGLAADIASDSQYTDKFFNVDFIDSDKIKLVAEYPVYTLSDLTSLDIIHNFIKDGDDLYELTHRWNNRFGMWEIGYYSYKVNKWFKNTFFGEELIDAYRVFVECLLMGTAFQETGKSDTDECVCESAE